MIMLKDESWKKDTKEEKKNRCHRPGSICCLSHTSDTSVTHTDWFDWWEPIHLDVFSAGSKFIFPQVPSSINGCGVDRPRLSAPQPCLSLKTGHSLKAQTHLCLVRYYLIRSFLWIFILVHHSNVWKVIWATTVWNQECGQAINDCQLVSRGTAAFHIIVIMTNRSLIKHSVTNAQTQMRNVSSCANVWDEN